MPDRFEDIIRGDPENPITVLENAVFAALDRNVDAIEENPAHVAALFIEYADAFRQMYDLDVEAADAGESVIIIRFSSDDDSLHGWLNAPRRGDYLDVDVDELNQMLDIDVDLSERLPGEGVREK